MKIFNTLSGKKEQFIVNKKNVGIYVCGVTPYDITHLGHAFTYVIFDIVIRYLEYLGNKVTYIQNITDVDDDLLKKANELNVNWKLLAEKNFSLFLKDLIWLGLRMPDFFPRATDHIKEIIALNKILLEKGFAYERNGNLYFSIDKDKDYGKLSKLSRKEMLALSKNRGNDPDDRNKKNPLDFVLWVSQKEGEPSWASPWSLGRPGWHIECSAMSMKYLGVTIDIHGGGGDLIYPHHESEIAQSESVAQKPFARFFMHTSMLYYQGHKMSKSLGNMIFIKDLKDKYSANVIRLLLLNHNYRTKWEYTNNLLDGSRKLNDLFKQVWLKESGQGNELDYTLEKDQFFESMNDDFNTPLALKVMEKLAFKITKSHSLDISSAKFFLNACFNILGLTVEY